VLTVLCQDEAGNISKEPGSFKVRLDTSVGAPEIASSSHPNPQQWYAFRQVELSWKAPADLSGIDGYSYFLSPEENGEPDPKSLVWTQTRSASLSLPEDGVLYFHLRAKDMAGNTGPFAHFKVQVDSQAFPPTVKSSTHPVNHWV